MTPKYSICTTHYNMIKTVEESLESILNQIDDRFEVVVVDAGSDDGSLEYLKQMEEEGRIRLFVEEGCSRGKGRQIATKKSKGDYLIHQVDMDLIYYEDTIPSLMKFYHQLEEQMDKKLCLIGGHMVIGRKGMWLENNYRDLQAADDMDIFRRLTADSSIELIRLKTKGFFENIGYHWKTRDPVLCKFGITYAVSEFRSGISFWSFVKWHFMRFSIAGLSKVLVAPISYLIAKKKGMKYSLPGKYKNKGFYWDNKMSEQRKTLQEIEEEYDVKINKEKFSENFKERLV